MTKVERFVGRRMMTLEVVLAPVFISPKVGVLFPTKKKGEKCQTLHISKCQESWFRPVWFATVTF